MDCQATSFVSVTQSDPTSATDPIDWPAPVTVDVSCPAKQLLPQQRQDLAIQVLAGLLVQAFCQQPALWVAREQVQKPIDAWLDHVGRTPFQE